MQVNFESRDPEGAKLRDVALARLRVLSRTRRRSRNTEHALEHRLKREFDKTAQLGTHPVEHSAAHASQTSRAGDHTTRRDDD